MKTRTRNIIAIVLLGIGSLQMIGYATQSRILRGLGAASGIAPFPKVFCAADGYEAFAASFVIEGELAGERWSRKLDPEWYSRLEGPYNRRNVYGAALAFAPRLPAELRDTLLLQALSPGSRLREELGIPPNVEDLKVIITPRDGEKDGPWAYQTKTP
jgi:hypothetical protein